MTYWMLNACFLAFVALVVVAALFSARHRGTERLSWRAIGVTALVLLVLTAIFDNAMILVGLFEYNPGVTAAARLGVAPLEDFSYTIAAVLLLPSLWVLTARKLPVTRNGNNTNSAERSEEC